MANPEYKIYLDLGVDLARKAGKIIRAAHGKTATIQTKASDLDLVTETDVAVENLLITGIRDKFPTHKFLAEESYPGPGKFTLTDEPTWIIDPIDGTTNFVHGMTAIAVSIGLYINKAPVVGIIFNPITDQLYSAIKGQGAFLNGVRLKVSGQTELKKSLVCYDIMSSGIKDRDALRIRNVTKLMGNIHGNRILGSAALSLAAVAAGQADVYFEYGIRAWDMAAGVIIIQEAGGVVIDPEGGPFDVMRRRVICASSESLAKQFSELLEHVDCGRD